jgi:hypothetical protein
VVVVVWGITDFFKLLSLGQPAHASSVDPFTPSSLPPFPKLETFCTHTVAIPLLFVRQHRHLIRTVIALVKVIPFPLQGLPVCFWTVLAF